MKIEKITFDDLRTVIQEIIKYKPHHTFELTPNKIFCVVEETGVILERKQIEGWNEFEYGNRDISIEELMSQTKMQLNIDDPLIIVTDECFKDQKAYKISSKNLIEFADTVYFEKHQMDLVQPMDIIFVQPATESISMIHHEGLIMEY